MDMTSELNLRVKFNDNVVEVVDKVPPLIRLPSELMIGKKKYKVKFEW